MENASKALLIAGAILIAMMILTLLVSVGTSMSDMAGAQDKKLATQQIAEFNQSYLAYNKTRMYGTDVITVYNKAKDKNEYDIQIDVIDKDGDSILIENNQSFKASVFKCEEIHYDSNTGRISRMIFRKIDI